MDKPITIYGAIASGSLPIEAALTLIGLPYDLIDGAPWVSAKAAAAVAKINPMRQVPTLVLPGGEVMTESAAILIWLADRYPQAHLAPQLLSRRRPAFLRWMSFVSSSIYALYWVKDDPSRLAADKAHEPVIVERSLARITDCWRMMDAQVDPGRYLLGDDLSVLDLYVTVVSRFRPRRKTFYAAAPRMADVVRRVDADPRLAGFWAERFPFKKDWEG